MATDKKVDAKDVVKPTAEIKDPVIEDKKVEVDPRKEATPPADNKPAEGSENGAIEVAVVVDPAKEKAELKRIDDVVRKAYEGKGSFSDNVPDGFGLTLIGKSDEEIIEAVKPYFNFADGSQKENANVQDDIKNAAGIVEAIAGLSQSNEYKAQALKHMEAQNLKEIWRCPDTGYWFTRKDYAEEYERKNKCSLEYYKK